MFDALREPAVGGPAVGGPVVGAAVVGAPAVGRPVAAALAACADLSAYDGAGGRMSPEQAGEELLALFAARAQLEAAITSRVAVADAGGLAAAEGSRSTASWLRWRARLDPAAAASWVQAGRALTQLPETAAAFTAGQFGFDHVRAITEATHDVAAEVLRSHEATLVDIAREATPGRVRAAARRIRLMFAGDDDPDAAEQFARRRFGLHQTFGGMWHLEGMLSPDAGALLAAALSPLMTPAGEADTRTPTQRRADALCDIARVTLASEQLPDSGGEPVHLAVTIDWAALSSGRGAGQLDWAGPASLATIRRLCCDSPVIRAVLGAGSEVLDLGRTVRVVTRAQRRALMIRDGGCVFPGCDRPPIWCQAHHLWHWVDGGPTDMANLCLLCSHHHHLMHQPGWLLVPSGNGGWRATAPDGRRFTRRPRAPSPP